MILTISECDNFLYLYRYLDAIHGKPYLIATRRTFPLTRFQQKVSRENLSCRYLSRIYLVKSSPLSRIYAWGAQSPCRNQGNNTSLAPLRPGDYQRNSP